MAVSKIFIEFMLYSLLGWVWESIYCTTKEREWQNRGFLFGPVCPIYGVGATVVSLLFSYVPPLQNGDISALQLFMLCAGGSAVVEYLTSFILERIFHAKWWDYSEMPLNINGRICLPATVGFGLAGIVIVRYLFPIVDGANADIPAMTAEVLALILMAIFAADLALTVASLTQLISQLNAYQDEFDRIMEAQYQRMEDRQERLRAKVAEYSGHMSYTQRQALRKIKHFSLPSRNAAALRIKDTLPRLGRRK